MLGLLTITVITVFQQQMKNIYNKCQLCNKIYDEELTELVMKLVDMKDNFLIDKNARFSLDLMKFKPNVGKDDYIYFSTCVYDIWTTISTYFKETWKL